MKIAERETRTESSAILHARIARESVSYGGVIRRTGMGEVPETPITGLAALRVELQPTMLTTVMLMLPAGGWPIEPGAGSTWLMNACRNPTTVTVLPALRTVSAITGMVTIELLLLTD